jgi:hypothetical protein
LTEHPVSKFQRNRIHCSRRPARTSLATSAYPTTSPPSPLSIPRWRSPDPGQWTVETFHRCLPVTRPASMRVSRCRGQRACRSACGGAAVPARAVPSTERQQRSRRARKVFPPQPPLETLAPALSRAYKNAPFDAIEEHTTAAPLPSLTLFFSLSESSDCCKPEPPRSEGVRPPLESPPVPGGGVELPPPFSFTAVEFCFLSVEPHRRAVPLPRR